MVLTLREQTMLVAFGIAFGALMLGLAIAFGMGGQRLGQAFPGEEVCSREEGGERRRTVSALVQEVPTSRRLQYDEISSLLRLGG